MWTNILFFTLIFLFKNILLDLLFNYTQTFLFAFELASLSIFDKEYIWTNYFKLFLLNINLIVKPTINIFRHLFE